MNCIRCHTELVSGERFCTECGLPVAASSEPPLRQPQPLAVKSAGEIRRRQPASTEKRQELLQRTESVGSLNADNRPTDAGSGSSIWDLLLALLWIPFFIFGMSILLFGSAAVACLPLLLVLFALGIEYNQLGAASQGLLGILMLALTAVVAGLVWEWLLSALNAIKDKARAYLGLRPK